MKGRETGNRWKIGGGGLVSSEHHHRPFLTYWRVSPPGGGLAGVGARRVEFFPAGFFSFQETPNMSGHHQSIN